MKQSWESKIMYKCLRGLHAFGIYVAWDSISLRSYLSTLRKFPEAYRPHLHGPEV